MWRQHNTFAAAFLDLDDDHGSDLVIAQDTGRVEMYANELVTITFQDEARGDRSFENVSGGTVLHVP